LQIEPGASPDAGELGVQVRTPLADKVTERGQNVQLDCVHGSPAGYVGEVDNADGDEAVRAGQAAPQLTSEGLGAVQFVELFCAAPVAGVGDDLDEEHGQSPRTLRRLIFWAWRSTRSRSARLKPAMAARQRRACDATSSAEKTLSRGALKPSCLRNSGVRSLGLIGCAATAAPRKGWRAGHSPSWRARAGIDASPGLAPPPPTSFTPLPLRPHHSYLLPPP